MTKHFVFILGLITLLGYSSCEKAPEPEPPTTVDNHITFSVNNQEVIAKYKVLLQDEVFNAYYKKSETIEMQRLVANGNPERIIFSIQRFDLLNTSFPVTIKYSTLQDEPTLSATYVSSDNMPFGTNINNPDDFSITVNSYTNNVLNCNFTGKLFSGNTTKPSVDITNGEVNLEIVEFD